MTNEQLVVVTEHAVSCRDIVTSFTRGQITEREYLDKIENNYRALEAAMLAESKRR